MPHKTNAARASHPSRIVRGFLLCLITAERRNDRFSPTAIERSAAAFAKASCGSVTLRSRIDNRHGWPAALSCSEKQNGGGGRNAWATSRACARFLDSPRQFTLENHRLPLALPQSFGKLRNFHVSLQTLSARSLRPATGKSAVVVQKLWRIEHPCGRQRKTKN